MAVKKLLLVGQVSMYTELTRALSPDITYLYFTITSRCNAFCDFCWNWKNVADAGKLYQEGGEVLRNELSLKEIEKLTVNLPKMLLVDLFGGEPFVREDIGEIIDLFVKNCQTKYFSIPTNAYYTDRILNVIEKSAKKYPKSYFRMSISVDGPAKVHNRVRKLKDGYQNAMATARGLKKLKATYKNISLSLNSVYDNKTQDTMEVFLDEMMEQKLFDSICLGVVRGDPFDPSLVDVNLDNYFRLKEKTHIYRPSDDQPFSPLQQAIENRTRAIIERAIRNPDSKREFKCFGASKFALLDDTGEVFSCEHLLNNSLGNIRDYDYNLAALMNDKKACNAKKNIKAKKCNCQWDCAIDTGAIFDPLGYPKLVKDTAAIMLKGKS